MNTRVFIVFLLLTSVIGLLNARVARQAESDPEDKKIQDIVDSFRMSAMVSTEDATFTKEEDTATEDSDNPKIITDVQDPSAINNPISEVNVSEIRTISPGIRTSDSSIPLGSLDINTQNQKFTATNDIEEIPMPVFEESKIIGNNTDFTKDLDNPKGIMDTSSLSTADIAIAKTSVSDKNTTLSGIPKSDSSVSSSSLGTITKGQQVVTKGDRNEIPMILFENPQIMGINIGLGFLLRGILNSHTGSEEQKQELEPLIKTLVMAYDIEKLHGKINDENKMLLKSVARYFPKEFRRAMSESLE